MNVAKPPRGLNSINYVDAGQAPGRPRWSKVAMVLALLWTALIGLSRMVLGVHWPSDVLAALCLGVLIALLLRVGLDLYLHHSPPPAHGTPGTN